MPSYKTKKNQIIINNKTITFETNIKQIYEYKDILIIVTRTNEKELDNEPNVCAISSEGKIIWEIEQINRSLNKYIEVKEEENCLVVYDTDHFKYVINPDTGTFIKKKIMPLKSINDDSTTLFTKQNLYQLIGIFVVIIILFMLLIPKKDNKEQIDNSSSQQIEQIINEETSKVIEETKIEDETSKKENETITELRDVLSNKFGDGKNETSKKEEPKEETTIQTSQVVSIQEEEFPSENHSQTQTSTQTQTPEKEKDPYEGINKVVGIFEDVSNAIQNGDATSIEEMQEANNSDCVYLGLDGEYLKVSLKGEEKLIKLISIKENSISKGAIESFLREGQGIYIEQDIKKDKDGVILAYVWITEDKSDITKMLNHYLIYNRFATFEMQTPNIKYNYKFQKTK